MNVQVLVSTMYQSDHSLLEKMNIQSDAIIINQCDRNEVKLFNYKDINVKWVDSTDKGLSKSRNVAIQNAKDGICILSDDDLMYINGYADIVAEQFEKHPKADVIAFQVEGIEKKFKTYYPVARKLNYLTSMKVSSVEIAFRLSSIRHQEICFNESFGAGAKYYMGEENIFLFDCIKRKLKVFYIPIKIADLHVVDSSWFRGFNREYFICRGASFTGMSRIFSVFLIIQFTIRKYKLFGKKNSWMQSIKYMLEGRRQYINQSKHNGNRL